MMGGALLYVAVAELLTLGHAFSDPVPSAKVGDVDDASVARVAVEAHGYLADAIFSKKRPIENAADEINNRVWQIDSTSLKVVSLARRNSEIRCKRSGHGDRKLARGHRSDAGQIGINDGNHCSSVIYRADLNDVRVNKLDRRDQHSAFGGLKHVETADRRLSGATSGPSRKRGEEKGGQDRKEAESGPVDDFCAEGVCVPDGLYRRPLSTKVGLFEALGALAIVFVYGGGLLLQEGRWRTLAGVGLIAMGLLCYGLMLRWY